MGTTAHNGFVTLLRGAAACFLALLTVGCASTKPPTFRAVDASAVTRPDDSVEVIVVVEGTNQRDIALPLRRVEYALSLDGRQVFAGERSPEVTLPGFGTRRFELPAVIARSDLGAPSAPGMFKITGTVWYEEPGKVAEALRDYRLRVPRASLDLTGNVSRTR